MPAAAPTSLAADVARSCLAGGLLAAQDAVLVAVSAGADSTALACLLADMAPHGLPLRLVLGHVDHGWRGPEAARADRALVEGLGTRLGLPVACAPAPPAGTGRSEDAARRHRYRALARLAQEASCTLVATGHHAGDQAETLLMRLRRGAGLVGLAGIPPMRPLHPGLTVVRPLLAREPAELRALLLERKIPWHEDPTNADLTRDRARVRASLAARDAAAPDAVRTLAVLAGRLRRRLTARLERLRATAARRFVPWPEAGCVAMPREDLAPLLGEDLALALRLAGLAIGAARDGPWLARRHVACAQRLLQEGGDLDLPRGLRLHVAGRRAWLARREFVPLPLPGLVRADTARRPGDLARFLAEHPAEAALLDASVLGPDASLRLLESGDRFVPYGRGAHEVDAVAWLSRRGIPGLARRGQLVLDGARGIAWLVGRRVDARHAVGPQTATVARVEIDRSEGATRRLRS